MVKVMEYAPYLVLAVIIMLPLAGQGYYLALDMQFGPASFADHQFGDLYGTSPSAYGAYLPMKLVFAALSQVLPVEALEKLLLLGILFLCGAGLHAALPERLGASRYFGGLLYMLNPFVFVRFLAGHWALLLSYAFWPLAIACFMDFLSTPSDRRKLGKALLMTALASISSHGLFMLLISYSIIFLAAFASRGWEERKGMVAGCVILALAFLAVSLFWILPTILLYGTTYAPASSPASYLADFGAQGNGMPLPLALLTMHGFWRGGFTYTKDVFQYWYVPFAAIALLSLAGIIAIFRKDAVFGASLIALFAAAFLLALGSSGPLLGIANALGDRIPIYLFLRDSQKFVGLLALVYAIGASYGLDSLAGALGGRKAAVLVIAALALPLVLDYGMFGFLGQIGPTQYPADWAGAESIIAADNSSGSILVLPLHLYNYYPWVNGTQQDLGDPAIQYFSKPVITSQNVETANVYSDAVDPAGRYMAYLFENRATLLDMSRLMLPLDVRYVMISKDDPDYVHYLFMFGRKGGVSGMTKVYDGPTITVFRDDSAGGPVLSSDDPGAGGFEGWANDSSAALAVSAYSQVSPTALQASSPDRYTILAQPFNPFLEMDGAPPAPWHGIANAFPASSGRIDNRLFYGVLGLLLLSWLVCMSVLAEPAAPQSALLVLLSLCIFVLVADGALRPAGLGWALALSFAVSLAVRMRRPHPSRHLHR